jgi:hypothetical protein
MSARVAVLIIIAATIVILAVTGHLGITVG